MNRLIAATALVMSISGPAFAGTDCTTEDLIPKSQWTKGEISSRQVTTSLDLDGDGIDDQLVAWKDSGSGFASSHAKVTLGKSTQVVEVEAEFAFARMADETEVPAALRGKGRRALRHALARVVFGRVCKTADPTLRRLLSPSGALEWHSGKPQTPTYYTVLENNKWYTVAGHMHRELRSVDRDERHELFITRHGAVIRDLKTQKFAWVHVFAGHGYHKLRWESVLGGKLDANTVVLDVQRRGGRDGTMQPGTVVIDLGSGHTATSYP